MPRQETIAYDFQANSNLNLVEDQLLKLIALTNLHGTAAQQTSQQLLANYQKVITELRNINAATNQNTAAIKTAGTEQANALNKIHTSSRDLVNTLRDMRTIIGVSFSIQQVVAFGESVVEAKGKIDLFKSGLTQMLGSKAQMNQLYEQIIQLAIKTPFEVEQLFQTTFMLKGMGVAASELIPTLQALGNMAAVAGQDKLPLIAKAYTDVMNKGKLMKQEINQFAENGIPLYDLLSESMGKTRAEIVKMAEQHTISFADVKKAIADASKEGGRYYQMMTLQSETLAGQVSNLKDRFFVAKAGLGDYYENGLKKVISGLSDFIGVTIGSSQAIQRTENIVKSIVLSYTAWRLATSELITAEKLLSAASVARNAVMAAGQLAMGTWNLLVIAAAGSTDVLTAAQVRSAAAARALWASMASNPLGAALAAVTALVAGYYAWQAATAEVTAVLTDHEFQLKKEQTDMEVLIKQAMLLGEGTDARRVAIQTLINKYPDYFSGLKAEQINNDKLRSTLEDVNTSYRTRIALAREAYKTEQLEAAFKKTMELETYVMDLANKRLPKEVMIRVNGDASKLEAEIKKSPELMRQLNGTLNGQFKQLMDGHTSNVSAMLGTVTAGIAQYENGLKESNTRTSQLNKRALDEQAAQALKHYIELEKSIKASYKSGEIDKKEYTAQLAQIDADYRKKTMELNGAADEKELKTLKGKEGQMKTIRLNSANEIKAELLAIDERTIADRIKTLQAQEKAEIDSVNRIKVSSKASQAEIEALREESLQKQVAIHKKYQAQIAELYHQLGRQYLADINDISAREAEANQTALDSQTLTLKEKKKAAQEAAKEATRIAKEEAAEKERIEKEYYQKTDQYRKEETAAVVEGEKTKQRLTRETAGLLIDMVEKLVPGVGEMGRAIKAVLTNWDSLSGEAYKKAEERRQQAQADLDKAIENFKVTDQAGDVAIQKARANLSEAQSASKQANLEYAVAMAGIAQMAVSIVVGIANAITGAWREGVLAIADGIKVVREANENLFAFIAKASAEAYKLDLQNAQDNYAAKTKIINEYYEQQKRTSDMQAAIDAELAYHQKFMEMRGNQKKLLLSFEQAKQDDHYREVARQEAEIILMKRKIQALEDEKAKAADVRDAKIAAIDSYMERFKQYIQEEIDKAKAATDAKIDEVNRETDAKKAALQQQLDEGKAAYERDVANVKAAYDAQLDALRAKQSAEKQAVQDLYDYKAQMLEQSTNDEIEKMGIIDRVRSEAIDRYKISEEAKLIATRDRILATLTDEGERARVTAEFEQRIQQLHSDVEDAKLDKTKGVSMATTQLRNEEKAEAVRLKEEEKQILSNLEQTFTQLVKTLSDERDQKLQDMKAAEETRQTELKQQMAALEKQSKDTIEGLRKALAEETDRLNLQNKVIAIQAEYDKAKANKEYYNAVVEVNQQIAQLQKAMAVAQLKAERATLAAKRNIFNANVVNAGLRDIDAAINEINGLPLPGAPTLQQQVGNFINNMMGTTPDELKYVIEMNAVGQLDKVPANIKRPAAPIREDTRQMVGEGINVAGLYHDGNPFQVKYNPTGRRIAVKDANGLTVYIAFADGLDMVTGQFFAKGTEHVPLPDGALRGIDTVPAWLTEGERVMTVSQNKRLNGIKNEELVRRSELFDRLQLQAAMPLLGGLPQTARLAAMAAGASGGSLDMGALSEGLTGLRKALGEQKHLSIHMDAAGFKTYLTSQQGVITYHQNLLQR